MKISDFIFDFKENIDRLDKGFCRVRIFSVEGNLYVILTELKNNCGNSVTNLVEDIIEALINKGYVSAEQAIFIEHYEASSVLCPNPKFDIVSLTPKTDWKGISLRKFQKMLKLSPEQLQEFITNSLENKKFFKETERLILQHTPSAYTKFHENKEWVIRKLDIENNMKPKKALIELINNNANERELLNFFHSDLSFFGDMYAQLANEYIVIPEFPLDNGFIDFVIFTGRSRMDVIFVEVKGADFYLMNESGYADFNHKIHQAKKQIRDRLDSAVYHNYDMFRKFCHKLRQDIEKGKEKRAHLLGANGYLGVDPNKDIKIRTAIIGGRSRDELKESQERHKFERDTIPIELDSWDSWVARLSRN